MCKPTRARRNYRVHLSQPCCQHADGDLLIILLQWMMDKSFSSDRSLFAVSVTSNTVVSNAWQCAYFVINHEDGGGGDLRWNSRCQLKKHGCCNLFWWTGQLLHNINISYLMECWAREMRWNIYQLLSNTEEGVCVCVLCVCLVRQDQLLRKTLRSEDTQNMGYFCITR